MSILLIINAQQSVENLPFCGISAAVPFIHSWDDDLQLPPPGNKGERSENCNFSMMSLDNLCFVFSLCDVIFRVGGIFAGLMTLFCKRRPTHITMSDREKGRGRLGRSGKELLIFHQ